MSDRTVLAVDLGAESGRVVLGRFDGATVTLTEIHRFPSAAAPGAGGLLRWNLRRTWEEARVGLAKAAATGPIDAVGVDAFGLDYGLLDRAGELVDDPVSHRDPRVNAMVERAAAKVGRERLYAATGIQLMDGNAIYQLLADEPGRWATANRLLMVPDLLHHLLSGSAVTEYTAASTSGMLDMTTGRWATDLLDDLGLPASLLPDVVPPGTDLGPVRPAAGELAGTRVIAPASHDTASAVVSVPFTDARAGYISSGTWSLVGVETDRPVITEATRRGNLSNEGGFGGTIRLLRNCSGLWILQECRRRWAAEGQAYDYGDLVALAATAPGWVSLVDVTHPDFAAPGDMPALIRRHCLAAGEPVPRTVASTVRCVLDSLALAYRTVFADIVAATGNALPEIHVVGGGSRNRLLNQLTADAMGVPVTAGPVEASALGNVLVQLHALGELAGLGDIRALVRAATPPGRFFPAPDGAAEAAYRRYQSVVERVR